MPQVRYLAFVLALSILVLLRPQVTVESATVNSGSTVNVWLTTPDQANLLTPQSPTSFGTDSGSNPLTIDLDESTTYQQMDGFGASLTDASAWLIANALSPAARTQLMTQLFDRTNGIGLSYLRQPMGAPDFALSNYTYDDVPAGQTDFSLAKFSIAHDKPYILPLIAQALQINPSLRVMAVPWSAPAWMKSNGSLFGGSLKTDPATLTAYANYFVAFIQQYAAAGVPIHRIAPQNEPLNASTFFPTMYMDAMQQATFIASYLAPALTRAGLTTEIATYDHNWDNTSYAESVLGSAAGAFVSGSAWHCYFGTPSAMTDVHTLYPTKGIYFTECTASETSLSFADNLKWDMENLIIGAPLNWAQTITKWNMALDSRDGPQNQGCSNCRGLVRIDDTVSPAVVSLNYDYYTLGHISKFVQPGAFRIAATTFGSGSIEDVAFLNPDGSRVLIVLNDDAVVHTFKVRRGTESFSYSLAAGAAATFVWQPAPVPVTTPFGGSARAVPGTVPAEDFDDGGEGVAYHDTTPGNAGGQFRNTDVDIETSAEGGYDVGWIAAGEWLNYTVNVGSAGDYTVQLRVASPGDATMHVGFNGPSSQWKSVAIPATGGWQNWTTVSVPMTLGAGVQQMTLYFDTGGMNVRYASVASATTSTSGTLSPFSEMAVSVPGQILAANFDNGGEGVAYHDATPGNTGGAYRNTDVDLESSSEGGYDVGWIDAGEWLNYTVNVTAAGTYTLQLRVASPGAGASMHVGFNGPSQGTWKAVSIPATGGWQNWTTVSVPVTLGAGVQQMTLYFDTGGLNVLSVQVGP